MKIEEMIEECCYSLNHPERSIPEKPLITIVGTKTLFPHGGGPRPKRYTLRQSQAGAWAARARTKF